MDVIVLLILQCLNGFLGWFEEYDANNAINGLKEKPRKAPQRVDDINAKELVIGDRIRLKGGNIIPADAQLGAGSLEVDQSALTGDSLLSLSSKEMMCSREPL